MQSTRASTVCAFLQNFLTIFRTPPCFLQPFPLAAPWTTMVIAGIGKLSAFSTDVTTITFLSRYRSTAGRPKMCKNSPRRHTCKRSFENVWHLLIKTASMSRLGWASLYVLAFDGWVVQLGKHELLCFGVGPRFIDRYCQNNWNITDLVLTKLKIVIVLCWVSDLQMNCVLLHRNQYSTKCSPS